MAACRGGRYEGAPWLSPGYLHTPIEAGEDIRALRLLGKPKASDPGFYHWFLGLAFDRTGATQQATRAFNAYFTAWPGDILGRAVVHQLENEG